MSKLSNIPCPVCQQRGDWFAGDFGPFCSKRCRLIDLGKWFSEEHAISEPLRPEHLEKYAELPAGKHLDNTAEETGEFLNGKSNERKPRPL